MTGSESRIRTVASGTEKAFNVPSPPTVLISHTNSMASNLLRHTVATLAYRAGKTLRGAPPEFANFQASAGTRTPAEILAHVGDLLDWAISLADGAQAWRDSKPLEWDKEVERFFRILKALDDRLAAGDLH